MSLAPQIPPFLHRHHRPIYLALVRIRGALAAGTALAAWMLGPGAAAAGAAALPAGGGGAITSASAAHSRHASPARAALAAAPVGATLRPGMSGQAVKALQRRLARLRYYPGPVSGRFGMDTLEAVWAFKEVQGLPTATNPDVVGPAMRRALASPRLPRPLVPRGGSLRIEVNLARETLVLYRHNKIDLISHVSAGGGYYYRCPGGGTCGPAITPDGNYHAHWFASGWLRVPLGLMYNPVFFIGSSFAIHGDARIPLRPASHGCVRIPVDVASFLHNRIRIGQQGGTPIYIRGHAPRTWPVQPRPERRRARAGWVPQGGGSSPGGGVPDLMTPTSHR
jgi:Putative peptidoglycan binding domain/L,D-transpeptidase catalytic domain